MRILLLPASFLPNFGGLQSVTHSLARELATQGHAVRVITNRYPRSLPAREIRQGVEVERVLFLTPSFGYLRRKRPDLFLSAFVYSPLARRHLKHAVARFQPDVINVHFPDAQIPFVLWLRKQFHFHLVVSLHGHDIERWFKDKAGLATAASAHGAEIKAYRAFKTLLQEADRITACSCALAARAAQIEPSLATKTSVIHNGIETARFQNRTAYQHPKPYVIAFGRLTAIKGFDLLLRAFAASSLATQGFDLVIAGAGEEEIALRQLVDEVGLKDIVHLIGWQDPSQIVQLLNGCACLVVTSLKESFGLTALEGMAAGKRVIATNVGGLPEFVTLPENILVEPSVVGICDGLERWLREGNPVEFAERNRLRAAEFDQATVAKRYLDVFSK